MHTVLALLALVTLVMILSTHRRLRLGVRPRDRLVPRPTRYPSLTIIRPIKGLDVGARENTDALLATDYPGELEILFIVDDDRDPSVPLVQEALARHRGPARVELLFAGAPPAGRTGKLHAMIVATAKARGELVAFSDSDTRPERPLVRQLVDQLLSDGDTGDVFAPALVENQLGTAGDVGYALLLNGWYGAAVESATGARGELPFIMGQLMVLRRTAIAAIGGLSCADGQLVDDMYLGRRIADTGLINVLSSQPLAIATGGMSWSDFMKIFRRWLLFSKNGLPATFTRTQYLRGAELWAALVLLLFAIWSGALLAGFLAAVALTCASASQIALHRAVGGAPVPLRLWWVAPAIPLLAPAVIVSTLVDHAVDWRGREYDLDAAAKLQPVHLDELPS